MKSVHWYLLFVAITLACSACEREQLEERPNVVIIFIDDMGYGDLSCYGDTVVQTRHIDALAAGGIRFTNFYVNSPICSPSRVALNTGRYPMRYKIHSYIASSKQNNRRAMAHYLDPAAPTLARTLQENGYTTGHFGKWHMGGGRDLGDVPFPTDYGFDTSLVSFEGIGPRVLFPNDGLSKASAALGKGEIIWAEKHQSPRIYVDHALAFAAQSGDQPFYLNLCPNDVHDPFLPDSLQWEKWRSATVNPFEQRFFAVLEEMDRQIGRLVKGLREMGKLDNTLILLASDNGPTDWPFYRQHDRYPEGYQGERYPPGFTGGFFGRKWSLYEGGIREPLIASWPGHIPSGQTDDQSLIAAFDLFPSICALLGIEPPEELDGTDKSRALLGNPLLESPSVKWEYASNPGGSIQPGTPAFRAPNLAIRENEWKLLVNVDGTDMQLFNLAVDPGEQKNLVGEEKALSQRLSAEVIAWRKTMPVDIPPEEAQSQ